MARLARVTVQGLPHHVTSRGNGRARTFFRDADHALNRDLLVEPCSVTADPAPGVLGTSASATILDQLPSSLGIVMNATRTMTIQGALLVMVGVIHLAMTGEIGRIVAHNTTPAAFAFLWPPYALDHIVVGLLLAAIGAGTILCGPGVAARDARIWRIALTNAIAVCALPVAVVAVAPLTTVTAAAAFLAATLILIGVGLWMLWPLWRCRPGRRGG